MPVDDKQSKVLSTRDKDILVTAGAGSGKTSTMILHIADSIVEHNISITELLVVTFTNAAAAEMRQRLDKKLNEIIADRGTETSVKLRLRKELDLLMQSDISTLHKFCQNLIKKYFYVLDIDPSFTIGEESETITLRMRAFNDVIRTLTEQHSPELQLLMRTFDDKRNHEKIKNYVFKIYDFLTNQPSISAFFERIDNGFTEDLDNSIYCQTINAEILDIFNDFIVNLKAFRRDAEFIKAFELIDYIEQLTESLAIIKEDKFTKNHYLIFNALNLPKILAAQDEPEAEDLRQKLKSYKENISLNINKIKDKILISDDLNEISKDLSATRNIIRAMFKLVEKFTSTYLKLKQDRNILDFSDLEHYAYEILKNEQVRLEVANSYKIIYVDEYQDINDIQESIIERVHYKNNLFLVGDVKQSIYGFRNTNPQIFIEKKNQFAIETDKTTAALPLNYNYRTDYRILEFINFIFGKLMTEHLSGIDYYPDNEMISPIKHSARENALPHVEIDIVNSTKEDKIDSALQEVYHVKDAESDTENKDFEALSEAQIIAERIDTLVNGQKEIFDSSINGYRPVKYSDITLLARSRSTYLSNLTNEIMRLGIPIAGVNREHIFEEYEIAVLFAYLNLVDNTKNDIYLTEFLMSPIIGVTENEAAEIRKYNPDSKFFYECVLNYNDENLYDFDSINTNCDKDLQFPNSNDQFPNSNDQFVNNNSSESKNTNCDATDYELDDVQFPNSNKQFPNINPEIAAKINYALDLIECGKNLIINDNIFNLLNHVVEATQYLNILGIMEGGEERVNNVLSYINSFLGKKYNTDLQEYLAGVEVNGTQKLTAMSRAQANCVNVETMHHSKGLEYPIVFIVDAGHAFVENDLYGDFLLHSVLGVGMYSYNTALRTKHRTISHSAVAIAIKNKSFAENLRLLYVAMTRAKNHLFISGSMDLSKFKSERTPFALKNNKNFLSLILNAFSTEEAENILSGSGKQIWISKDSFVKINIIKPTKTEIAKNEVNLSKISGYDAKFSNLLTKNMNFEYPNSDATKIGAKNTVTILNRAENEAHNFVLTPKVFNISEHIQVRQISVQTGNAYHRAMQIIDYELTTETQITEFLREKLQADEFNLIDCHKIYKAVEFLRPLLSGARVLREQEFLMRVPYCEIVESDITDCVLVQGVIDLLIIKNNEVILVDFKTSGTKNPELTAKKYAKQLFCYTMASENALNCKISRKFLYFFLQECAISFDN